ncbi:hypothetical protein F4780DRAFT_752044 [Xylariomycetidae sp. FL0641]|nr:hypothetical protein F4780DRAFT_752044 [Xylariomycetidae sp. FL0641]
MALSAMHLSRTTVPSSKGLAESYHGKCIHGLISIDPNSVLIERGVALAATCLLRSYEILDENEDPNRHLRGAYSFACQQQPILDSPLDRLRCLGFWNYLREDITFSLFRRCPLKMDLSTIHDVNPPTSDHDHLNAISLVLGRVVNAAIQENTEMSDGSWETLIAQVKVWSSRLPRHFEPFSRALVPGLTSLPSIRVLRHCHAAAWHYFSVCLSILILRTSSVQHLVEAKHLATRIVPRADVMDTKEEVLASLALGVCGIAFTSRDPSVLVNAYGPISFCSRYIVDHSARREVVNHLFATGRTTGWPVEQIISRLESSWEQHFQQLDQIRD